MNDPMAGGLLAGGLFFIVWLMMMVGMLAGWIITLVALWRGMKAHESIAATIEKLARELRSSSCPGS